MAPSCGLSSKRTWPLHWKICAERQHPFRENPSDRAISSQPSNHFHSNYTNWINITSTLHSDTCSRAHYAPMSPWDYRVESRLLPKARQNRCPDGGKQSGTGRGRLGTEPGVGEAQNDQPTLHRNVNNLLSAVKAFLLMAFEILCF